MTLIEGFGDELVYTLIVSVIILLSSVAWISTRVPDRPLLPSTILIIQRVYQQARNLRSNGTIVETVNDDPDQSSAPPVSPEAPSSAFSQPPNEHSSPTVEASSHEESSGVRRRTGFPAERRDDSEHYQQQQQSPPPPPPQQQQRQEREVAPEEEILVKLKFLNDTLRTASARKTDTVEAFRRRHFHEELAANKVVRLIYRGQFLHDQQTFAHYRIENESTIHCHVTQSATAEADTSSAGRAHANLHAWNHEDTGEEMEPGRYIFVVFGLILLLLWLFRLQYRAAFNPPAMLGLVGFSTLYVLLLVSQWYRGRAPTPARA